jgi:hypothetical protein
MSSSHDNGITTAFGQLTLSDKTIISKPFKQQAGV